MQVVHKHIVNKCGLDLDLETSHFTHWLKDMAHCTLEFMSAPMLGAIFGMIVEAIQEEKTNTVEAFSWFRFDH